MSSIGSGLFDTLGFSLLTAFEANYEDECIHRSLCVMWADPMYVFLCDVCGEVSVPEFWESTELERELIRPFKEAWL